MQKINLFVSYYQTKDEERQAELDFCRANHEESGLFDNIIPFNDRPTYNDFFKATKDFPTDINVLTNADIYFNDTINLCQSMGVRDAYALTRWEDREGEAIWFDNMHTYNKHAKSQWSQDVWIFRGAVNGINSPFHLGVPGCDNRIAYDIFRAGYNLTNPSKKIKCIHKHKEMERSYNIPLIYKHGKVPRPWKPVPVDEVQERKPI